jgi:membrane-bound metal-dependent hydrolase YbcI (DUF457 family)
MFIGHYAVGFGLKKAAPRTSLGILLLAPLLLDLLWPVFLLLGWESARIEPGNTAFTPLAFTAYPWSHSLAMAAAWGLALAALYVVRTRRWVVGGWLVLGVLSHWVLDAISHRPDVPLAPGAATLVGLGLWNSVPATVLVEITLFGAGLWLYLSTTRPRDRVGKYGLWSLVLVLLFMYAGAATGSPPPSVKTLALIDLGAWTFPLWAAWVDRHRETES